MAILGNKTKSDKKEKEDPKGTKTASVVDEKKSEKKVESSSKKKTVKDKKINFNRAYKVLIKPLVTEKATNLNTINQYVFEVAYDTNKVEVAKAIREVYNVKPISVNIIKMEGKRIRRGRINGRRKNWKKAIITLPKGEDINIYEGV